MCLSRHSYICSFIPLSHYHSILTHCCQLSFIIFSLYLQISSTYLSTRSLKPKLLYPKKKLLLTRSLRVLGTHGYQKLILFCFVLLDNSVPIWSTHQAMSSGFLQISTEFTEHSIAKIASECEWPSCDTIIQPGGKQFYLAPEGKPNSPGHYVCQPYFHGRFLKEKPGLKADGALVFSPPKTPVKFSLIVDHTQWMEAEDYWENIKVVSNPVPASPMPVIHRYMHSVYLLIFKLFYLF